MVIGKDTRLSGYMLEPALASGFVSAGISVGSAVAPIPFGYLLDSGRAEWVFYLMAIFMTVALIAVLTPKDLQPQPSS